MAVIKINQADLYYEIYAPKKTGNPPIVLIHGFPSSGANDWGVVATVLARNYTVIVPDCRGHGQSENPSHSYSFREMAADIAGLVQALGYERAHLIGHSNGGNVALVAVLEHPGIVQSAVLQAANAYVSDDLVEREPLIFDPERVRRENPALMEEMNRLHASTHGPGYWRELLRMGVEEIISQPNYTPGDLATVRCPTLVIQGEKDQVNARSGHGQFIAQHIPDAELWIPAGVGHSVHQELLFDWINHIEDFLQRRGDPLNDALHRLKQHAYNDPRETIFEVRATSPDGAGQTKELLLSGQVLHPEQLQSVESLLLTDPLLDTGRIRKNITVLLNRGASWALVNRAVTDVRRGAHTQAERLTQALLGESLRILEENGDWARVRLEQDGYLGWMQTAALYHCSEEQVRDYQKDCDSLVIAELGRAASSVGEGVPQDRAGALPFGITVPVVELTDQRAAVRLPDGWVWWLDSAELIPASARPAPNSEGIEYTLKLMQRFIGVPYLWGGRSPFGYDCSGFAQTFLGFLGIRAPRDADQQCHAAAPVSASAQPGDLYFFGSISGPTCRKITHVSIALGGGEMIHANGSAWGVSRNSLERGHPLYSPWLDENLAAIGRFG